MSLKLTLVQKQFWFRQWSIVSSSSHTQNRLKILTFRFNALVWSDVFPHQTWFAEATTHKFVIITIISVSVTSPFSITGSVTHVVFKPIRTNWLWKIRTQWFHEFYQWQSKKRLIFNCQLTWAVQSIYPVNASTVFLTKLCVSLDCWRVARIALDK